MAKSDGEDKKTTKAEQAEPELRPFYYPDIDLTIMAVDHDDAAKQREAHQKTLKEISKAKKDNGEQE